MNRKKVFDTIRAMTKRKLTQVQVDRINPLLDALDGISYDKAAYILATAFHESDHFRAMTEYASGRQYEGRRDLGNTHRGDGIKYKGRGYVQITGRANYKKFQELLGINLINEPNLASDPKVAVVILINGMLEGTFTGKKLDDYFNGRTDFYNARRIVNRLDRAELIAGYGRELAVALREGD